METNSINIFLDSVCNDIKCSQAKEDIRQELYEHILEEKNHNLENGIKNEEAELIAIKKMGKPEQISKDFNKVYKKIIDWKLLIIVLILTLINILLFNTVAKNIENNIPYIIKNGLFLILGVLFSILVYLIDYRKIQKFSLRCRNIGNYMYNNRNNFT